MDMDNKSLRGIEKHDMLGSLRARLHLCRDAQEKWTHGDVCRDCNS